MLLDIIKFILVFLALFYALLYFYQGKLLFFPQRLSQETSDLLQKKFSDVESISLTTEDGAKLYGWLYKPPSSAAAPLVIYFGGNAEEVSFWLHEKIHFGNLAWLFINYRGYGLSEGSPSQKNLFTDALFIYDNIVKRPDIDRDKIVVIGRSLGSGVATYLAANRPTRGVILISPYDSIKNVAQKRFPFVPISLLIKHPFESISYAPSIKVPLLALIAEQDITIPPSHSLNLISAWGGSKKYTIFKNRDHNTIIEDSEFWPTISGFLKSID